MFHAPQIGFKKSVNPQKRLSVWWKSRFLEHAASSPPCPRNWKSFVLFNLKSLLFFVSAHCSSCSRPSSQFRLFQCQAWVISWPWVFVSLKTISLSIYLLCQSVPCFQISPKNAMVTGRGCDGHDRHHEHQGVRRQQALSNQNIFEPKLFTPKLFQAAGP